MTKWIMVLLIFSLAVNIAVIGTLVYHWNHPAPMQRFTRAMPDSPPMATRPFFMEDSSIAPGQRQMLRSQRAEYHSQVRVLRQSVEQQRRRLRDMLLADSPQPDSINAIVTALAEKQAALERLTVNHLLSLKALLTPEQWERLLEEMGRFLPERPMHGPMRNARTPRRIGQEPPD
jgi:Spy/CpxP family protein refolding chaperone